ncbi:MAG: SatD family protein [Chitinophagaceae bacterium]
MEKLSRPYVLLADVVGSRRIEDRAAFDKKLQAALQQANQTFGNAFALPLQAWKGLDEVAAVLSSPTELYTVISVIQEAVAPQKFRFVLVRGNIDVVPASKDVREADGAAFHEAAEAMQHLKREGLLFSCQTGNALWDLAYSTQLNLLLLLKDDWTERQRSIYTAYTKMGRQEEVAAALQVTQQTVSKTLQAIKANPVQKLEAALKQWTKESLNG